MASKKAPDLEKMAIDALKEAAFHPDIDAVFAKDPREHTPAERARLVEGLRTERALWRAETERKEKKKKERVNAGGVPTAGEPAGEESWDD